MIHFITMALGGEGYLNFMGNEVCILLHSFSCKTVVHCVILGAAKFVFLFFLLNIMQIVCKNPTVITILVYHILYFVEFNS